MKNFKYILIYKNNNFVYDNLNDAYQAILLGKLEIGSYKLFKGEEVC